ncbi:1-phosphofructokinase family hexose kinase [Leifsonia sp. AG29]|uniref:1-phosphofructokinase family hexose kinase n=1 Tax=Leifsonia sp. AG29 TaxID=2598860 RepID=UPI00131EC85C|nr:1-phosphofructokinase family hexose kinase [Leifsonia sp. AG29]
MTGGPGAQQIVTLTINPALDVSASTDRVISGHKLRCSASRLDPGGGGVNVSRVVRRLGGRTLAVYTAGGPVGEAYRRLVDAERVPSLVVPIRGGTRQSFTVDEASTGEQYRFVLGGPELDADEWEACLDFVGQAATAGGYVVASGSLPPGVPDDFYARVVRLARDVGAFCIVDATGAALAAALAERPFLVTPSRRELEGHVGSALDSERAEREAAGALIAQGAADHVALTLGDRGAVLVSAERVMRLPAPHVTAASTVGAGDSFVAGFVLRLAQGRSLDDAFRTAVAAGSAAVSMPGTELCHRTDVEALEAALGPVETVPVGGVDAVGSVDAL